MDIGSPDRRVMPGQDSVMEDVGDFLLHLYRAARECGPAAFQDLILDRLHASFAFSSAFWGAGRFVSPGGRIVPTALHTQNMDPRFLLEWTQVQHDDPVPTLLCSAPGQAQRLSVPSFYAPQPVLAELGRSYRVQSMTVISMPRESARSLEWLSLYRERPDASCGDDEKRWLEFVAPHMAEAWRIQRALHPAQSAATETTGTAVAVAEASSGRLLCADDAFLTMLAREWSGFDGQRLPGVLRTTWQANGHFRHLTRHCRIDGRHTGELIYLSSRARAGAEVLTPRQREIAELYSQGRSSKQIAQSRQLSPATVRNHLATVYTALGVHGKLELARALAGLD